MTTRRFPIRHAAACSCLSLVLAGAPGAQIPADSAVIGSFAGPAAAGPSGLFLIDLASGQRTPVGNRPAALAQPGGAGFQQGVGSLAVDPARGTILVGTVSSATSPMQGRIELLELHLNGTSVDPSRTRRIHLGATTNTGGALIAALPDQRVIVIATDAQGALRSGKRAIRCS